MQNRKQRLYFHHTLASLSIPSFLTTLKQNCDICRSSWFVYNLAIWVGMVTQNLVIVEIWNILARFLPNEDLWEQGFDPHYNYYYHLPKGGNYLRKKFLRNIFLRSTPFENLVFCGIAIEGFP